MGKLLINKSTEMMYQLTQDAKLNFAVPDFKILRTVLEVSETDCKILGILKDNIGSLLFQNHVFHVR